MATSTDLEKRLKDLEQRVAELEQQNHIQPSTPDKETFWALDKLQHDHPLGALIFAGHVQLPTGKQYIWQEGEDMPKLLAADWQMAASALAALGHPLRLCILRAVLDGKQTTQDLQEQPDLSGAGKLYHHLRELQAAGWLTTLSRGRYDIPTEKIVPLLIILRATNTLDLEDHL